ncbi:MAG: flagellar basal body P-ring formation protein FlgA [Desulfuromonadales bacterium]|nr:flagellar basal body P-ring formation protein FlgA [Desulfuromonadales bacterium]MBN2792056.1 flagellar basal body P-ring formation protein FlgA [Desulfuromonadales bacterium]
MKYLLCLIFFLSLPLSVCGQTVSQQVIDGQEMEQVLRDYLEDQSSLLPHVELCLKSLQLPEAFNVPQGRIEHQVIPAKPGVMGSRRLTLMTRVDGKTVANQSIRVDVEALAEVVVVTSALRRGQILQADDIDLRYQDISKLKDPIFDEDEVVGKRLKRSVRLGAPLERHQIEFPPVIKRGQRVVIQAQGPGLMLTAAGEAREDGRSGEPIRVMNSSSRKEVLCQVIAPGLVRVGF